MSAATSSTRCGSRRTGILSSSLLATLVLALGVVLSGAPLAIASGVAPSCGGGLSVVPDAQGVEHAESGESTAGSISCDDDDGDAIAISIAAQPAHGTLGALDQLDGGPPGSASATFTYTPTPGYLGPDVLSFNAGDGTNDTPVAFAVEVSPPADDPPQCYGHLLERIDATGGNRAEAGEATVGKVSCFDDEQQEISITVDQPPAHGTLSELAEQPFGAGYAIASFSYTPAAGYLGADVFELKANDGTNDTIVEVALTVVEPVDDPPTCNAYLVAPSAEAGAAEPGYAWCADDEGQHVTYSLADAPGHGTLGEITEHSIPGGGPGLEFASFTYTADAQYRGRDAFTLEATDGANDTTMTVSFDVIEPVDDAPQCFGHLQDGPLVPAEAGEPNLAIVSCTDDEQQDLTFSVGQAPAHGTITGLSEPGGVPGAEYASFTYTPTADHRGPDAFTLKASDGTNDTVVDFAVTVVEAVDDPPQCFAYLGQFHPGGGFEAQAGEQSYGAVACTDDEQHALTFSLADPPAHGTLSAIDAQSGGAPGNGFASFTYIAAAAYRGPDVFKIRVGDAANDTIVAVSVTVVDPVNDAPQCIGVKVNVRQPTSVDVFPTCFDSEDDAMTYTVTGQPAHGQLTAFAGGFTYTPSADFGGSDEFRYRASDGNTSSDEVTVPIEVQAADPLILTPHVDTPQVGGEHAVLASARTANGAPQTAKRVRWRIEGAAAALAGDALTNASGQVEISWTRAAEGTDTLTAYVDSDDDGTRDAGEAQETATAHWRAQRDVDPPSAGQPTVNGDPVNVAIGTQVDPENPDERYFTISRSQTSSAGIGPCLGGGPDSRAVDLPITLPIEPGAGSTVQSNSVRLLLVDPATGDTSNPLDPPGPVVPTVSGSDYRFVLTCLRTGDLYVRYTLQDGAATQTYTVPVGGLTLIDPQGVVYDKARYDVRIAAGDTPAGARASAAISGATAVLQRKVGGTFATLLSGDPGISPHVNPQLTGADGKFQWDVSAGTYRIVASKAGYDSVTSPGYEIPPPKLDAHVAMTRTGSGVTAPPTPPTAVTPPPPLSSPTTGAPTPTPTTPPLSRPAATLSFAASPNSVRVLRTGVFTYPFTAPSGKSGKLGLRSARKLRIGAAKQFMSLAAQPFTASSAGKVKLRMRLSRKNLTALRRVKSLRFAVTATLGATTFRTTITLKAPRTA